MITSTIYNAPTTSHGILTPDEKYTLKCRGAVSVDKKKCIPLGIKLTAEQEEDFNKSLKIGILRQLHKDGMLTNEQLKLLINKEK